MQQCAQFMLHFVLLGTKRLFSIMENHIECVFFNEIKCTLSVLQMEKYK